MRDITKTLYIDALALVPERKSGVGVSLEKTLQQLLKIQMLKSWQVNLVVPLGKAKYLKKYESELVHTKTIYLPARVMAVLLRSRFMPPIDWLLGKGVYVFPNYRNWPLWRSRSVTYVYDIAYTKHPETVQIKNQKYLHRFMPRWVRRADRIVTISRQVKYEIEKYLGLSELKIDIVPCGVDRSIFYRRGAAEIAAVKKHYGITHQKYFLFVGNIEPRKNLEGLLDAYEELPAAVQKEYALILVGGEGWQNDKFYQKLSGMQQARKNVLKVAGYVTTPDLPALYSGATMLIHPAIYEGFGITPLEAMACGLPVAVADIPSVREVVQDAGQYFDPTDTLAIAQSVKKVLANAELTSVNVARGLALAEEFSWQRSAKELLRVVNFEQQQGGVGHPVLKRLKFAYQTADTKLLALFGERAYPPYVPPYAETAEELRQSIYNDFKREQPSRLQLLGKRLYLGTKHRASDLLKGAYHAIKTPAHEA